MVNTNKKRRSGIIFPNYLPDPKFKFPDNFYSEIKKVKVLCKFERNLR